ncbi:sporulation protein YtfJ [Bacillus sp. FJAT-27225]|uniref:GerW family sporulation protein n=1 Tax=Bacillus sp. FJAT-27225 TaxID=1743144 RepID=UPI00080C2A74|nr:GerW family sporulation protein [Bacillus sp. FJAT-27225]OCA91387.1 sporulation protein YtfJ [Bacillus sp. FJAT-27225]
MSDHPIQGLMTTAMESLKEMIDVNTIIGDPVETPDGSVILTVSKVGFGFAAGGTEFGEAGQESGGKHPFGGGSGGGVSITPIAFLIVNSQGVKMLHLDESTHLFERILETAPQAVDKIQQMLSKKSQSGSDEKEGQDKEKSKEKDKDKNKDSGNKKSKSEDEELDF